MLAGLFAGADHSQAATYAALGASDTVGEGASDYVSPGPSPAKAYAPQLRDYLLARSGPGSWTLNNSGVGGYTAPDIVNNTLPPAAGTAPKVVTIYVGGNDVLHIAGAVTSGNDYPDTDADPVLNYQNKLTKFANAYGSIIGTLKQVPGIVIVTANVPKIGDLPAAANAPYNLDTAQRAQVNQIVSDINAVITSTATSQDVPVVDLYSDTRSTDPTYLAADGFHPNDAGYTAIADGFKAKLQAALPDNQSLIVTTKADNGTSNDGVTTLREAMAYANSHSGADTITFAIPEAMAVNGVFTISPFAALPSLSGANGADTTIDGYSQPGARANTLSNGSDALLKIELKILSPNYNGITLLTNNCTVKGLVISGFLYGIYISGNTATGNVLEGNYIGTNAAGTSAFANTHGIYIEAPNNIVGGTTPAARNLVSGNIGIGVYLFSGPSTAGNNTVIKGNYVGTNASGSSALRNGTGIMVKEASNNTIGGPETGAGNLISGNSQAGIRVDVSAVNNTIRGNSIYANGTSSTQLGVDLGIGSTYDGVTGNDSGDGDSGPNNLQNYPVLNLAVNKSEATVVSGTLNSTADTIFTLDFYSSPQADTSGYGEGKTYLGNATVTTDGTGNKSFSVDLPTAIPGHVITTTATDPSGNTSEFSRAKTVVPNQPPVATDVTLNGTYYQPFTGQLTASSVESDSLTYSIVSGTLPTGLTLNPSTGAVTGTPTETVNGTTITFKVTDNIGESNIATATFNISINTSLVVTTIQDTINASDGMTSLREAITYANSHDGPDVITFNIPSAQAVGGVFTIALSSALPAITNASTTIDGYTQPGASPNTISNGTNAVLKIQLKGYSGSNLLTINASTCTVKGLSLIIFARGIYIDGSNASGTTIQGNYIGTYADGTNRGGGIYGISINQSNNNRIGGTTPEARNIISGNSNYGIYISGLSATGNVIQGNYIGTNAAGTSVLSNINGVYLISSNNIVGGAGSGAGNLISGNTTSGVVVVLGTKNTIRGNSIYDNGTSANHLGIELIGAPGEPIGVNANDNGDGDGAFDAGNYLQNYPVLSSAMSSGGTTTINGTLNSTANKQFALDFYSSPQADASGYGEGKTYIGSVTITTDNSGNKSFSTDIAALVTVGDVITATATAPDGSTSEFSLARRVFESTAPAATNANFTGTQGQSFNGQLTAFASDTGKTLTYSVVSGTLPSGLTLNTSTGAITGIPTAPANGTTVTFKVNDGTEDSNVATVTFTISEASSLIVTTKLDETSAFDGVTSLREAINYANSKSGADTVTFNIPANQAVDGVFTLTPGNLPALTGNNGANTTINGYSQPGASANTLSSGSNAIINIELNGINRSSSGITIQTSGCTVKGLAINRFYYGIHIRSGAATGNKVEGNYIGTNATGSAAFGNVAGVCIESAPNNTVGGTSNATRNVISGNANSAYNSGIYLVGDTSSGNTVTGNNIGTNATGTVAMPNDVGLYISGAKNNSIGGIATGAGNVISGNALCGVFLDSMSPHSYGTGNAIRGNSIYDNGTISAHLGIDLSKTSTCDGVTGNDLFDGDGGPNNLQNYPMLYLALSRNGTTTIEGDLNSTADTTFTLDFYSSPQADASNYGEGKTYLSTTTITTDASGFKSFSTQFAGTVTVGYVLTATATAPDGSTSEFSQVRTVVNNRVPTDMSLSPSAVAENQPIGTTVGTFATNDPDSGDTFAYALVSGTGSTDNASFEILGNTLKTKSSFNFEEKSSYGIRVKSTDAGGLSIQKQFTVSITDANEAPNDIALAPASVTENQPTGTIVGTFATTDSDTGDMFTYSLASGNGSDDNDQFEITGSTLKAKNSFDYETKASYSIRVRSTDVGNLTFERVFTITVTDVNETPANIALSDNSIAENAGANAVVGNLLGTDPDANDTLTFSLPDGVDDNAAFNINGTQLRANASFDFETDDSYTVTLRATDANNLAFDKQFTISVTNVNEAPVGIALSNDAIAENAPTNVLVGSFTTTDPDTNDTFTYSLVSGAGDEDNAAFSIEGNQLKTVNSFDFETKNSPKIRVKSVDAGGLSIEKQFTINVTNVNEAPTASNVTLKGSLDEPFSGQLVAGDVDSDALTYSIVEGALPDGLILDVNTGAINGTPTTASTTSVTYKVTDGNGAASNEATAAFNILGRPTLSFSNASIIEGDAGASTLTFTVTLSRAWANTITVDYTTLDNTAVQPTDYSAAAGTLTFEPGDLSKTINVSINGDLLDENNENFQLLLSNASGNIIIAGALHTATIIDNDLAPSIGINDVSVNETNGGSAQAQLTLTLSAPSAKFITVTAQSNSNAGSPVATASSDYQPLTATTVTFNPGQTTRTVNVTVLGDIIDESDEKFAVGLAGAVNASISDNTGVVTIIDNDDPPTISLSAPNVTEGNPAPEAPGGTATMAFTLKLSAASARNISVQYQTANATTVPATAGTDYTAVPLTTVIFLAGETTKTVNVTVKGDLLDEDNERIKLNLQNPVNATLGTMSDGIIVDDDATPSLSINDVQVNEGNSGTKLMLFTVTLSAASGRTITVNAATGNGGTPSANAGTDYVVLPSTSVGFAPGQTSKQVTVTINGDTTIEQNEKLAVIISGATNATIADNSGIGTILNDDGVQAPITAPPSENVEAQASSSASSVTLTFASAKAAQAVSDFSLTLNGKATKIQSVERKGAAVVLLLAEGTLKTGDAVDVTWTGGAARAAAN